jgi:hypothetical protein
LGSIAGSDLAMVVVLARDKQLTLLLSSPKGKYGSQVVLSREGGAESRLPWPSAELIPTPGDSFGAGPPD